MFAAKVTSQLAGGAAASQGAPALGLSALYHARSGGASGAARPKPGAPTRPGSTASSRAPSPSPSSSSSFRGLGAAATTGASAAGKAPSGGKPSAAQPSSDMQWNDWGDDYQSVPPVRVGLPASVKEFRSPKIMAMYSSADDIADVRAGLEDARTALARNKPLEARHITQLMQRCIRLGENTTACRLFHTFAPVDIFTGNCKFGPAYAPPAIAYRLALIAGSQVRDVEFTFNVMEQVETLATAARISARLHLGLAVETATTFGATAAGGAYGAAGSPFGGGAVSGLGTAMTGTGGSAPGVAAVRDATIHAVNAVNGQIPSPVSIYTRMVSGRHQERLPTVWEAPQQAGVGAAAAAATASPVRMARPSQEELQKMHRQPTLGLRQLLKTDGRVLASAGPAAVLSNPMAGTLDKVKAQLGNLRRFDNISFRSDIASSPSPSSSSAAAAATGAADMWGAGLGGFDHGDAGTTFSSSVAAAASAPYPQFSPQSHGELERGASAADRRAALEWGPVTDAFVQTLSPEYTQALQVCRGAALVQSGLALYRRMFSQAEAPLPTQRTHAVMFGLLRDANSTKEIISLYMALRNQGIRLNRIAASSVLHALRTADYAGADEASLELVNEAFEVAAVHAARRIKAAASGTPYVIPPEEVAALPLAIQTMFAAGPPAGGLTFTNAEFARALPNLAVVAAAAPAGARLWPKDIVITLRLAKDILPSESAKPVSSSSTTTTTTRSARGSSGSGLGASVQVEAKEASLFPLPDTAPAEGEDADEDAPDFAIVGSDKVSDASLDGVGDLLCSAALRRLGRQRVPSEVMLLLTATHPAKMHTSTFFILFKVSSEGPLVCVYNPLCIPVLLPLAHCAGPLPHSPFSQPCSDHCPALPPRAVRTAVERGSGQSLQHHRRPRPRPRHRDAGQLGPLKTPLGCHAGGASRPAAPPTGLFRQEGDCWACSRLCCGWRRRHGWRPPPRWLPV